MTLVSMVVGGYKHMTVGNLLNLFIVSSPSTVKRLRKEWNLQGTRQQAHTLESIEGAIAEARERYPFWGANSLRNHLFQTKGMRIPRLVCTLMIYDFTYNKSGLSLNNIFVKLSQIKSMHAGAANLFVGCSMQLGSTTCGVWISMTSGVHGLAYGSIIVLIHSLGIITGWRCGGPTSSLGLLHRIFSMQSVI